MILSGLLVTVLLWANLSNLYVWVVLGVTAAFAAIGFYDDYLKVHNANNYNGFSGRTRLAIEFVIAAIAGVLIARIGSAPCD